MSKMVLLVAFLLFSVSNLFAEIAERRPDTVFQKMAVYSKEGYKEDVKPIKKMTAFQFAADWVKGSSQDDRSTGEEKPSLFWK